MSTYVACYDIAHPGRRENVARILLTFGRRVQRSVYEVQLDPDDLLDLRLRVGPLLARTDRFDLFPIDARRPEARLRWQLSPRSEPVITLETPGDESLQTGGEAL